MNVHEIEVRYMRRVQVKDYEPAEAETTLKAQLEEGEDAGECGEVLMKHARELTGKGLTGKFSSDEDKTEEKPAEAKKKSPPKTKNTKKEEPKEDPVEEPVPGSEESVVDIPDDDDVDTLNEDPFTVNDLQDYVSKGVQEKWFTVKEVKEFLGQKDAARTGDVEDEDDRKWVHGELEKLAKKNGKTYD